MNSYVIGIDLGTSGIKAGVIDSSGKILSEVYWDAMLISAGPGRMKQNPDDFFIRTLDIMKEVVTLSGIKPESIAGMAIDGQMGGIVGIDKNFKPLTGLDMGLDMQSEHYNRLLHRELKEQMAEVTCGSPRNTPKMMMWKQEYPSVYKKIKKFITLNSYVAGKIANQDAEDAFIDYTLLSYFGNESAKSLSWSEELTSACNLDMEKMPKVVAPWIQIGKVSKEAASRANVPEGLPIFAGAGDQPAGFLGAGFLAEGKLVDVSGSTTLLCCAVDSFKPDTERKTVMYMPSVIKGKYTAFTYINGGGITLKWFRDELGADMTLMKLSKGAGEIPPGSGKLLFLPYLGGRQCPYDGSSRGSWIGLNWGHSKFHLYRAILEGLGYDYALGLESIRTLFPHIELKQIYAMGGGTKDIVWNSIKANILDLPYRVLPEHQYALRGSGLIAWQGLGMISNLAEFPGLTESELNNYVIKPNDKEVEVYKEYKKLFKNMILLNLKGVMSELQSLSV